MRLEAIVMATATLLLASDTARTPDRARCSYIATYPSAVGKNTYMLATATTGRTTAPVEMQFRSEPAQVAAQLMKIDEVAGFQSDAVMRGLKASGGVAVFVRYAVSASCTPWPVPDGMFDSVGANGLYVGEVRPVDRWIDGRPTFDIVKAQHFPLPQKLSAPSGHLVITRVDSTPVMSAKEMFGMYRALWAESDSSNETIEPRVRRWLKDNRQLARKQPANEVLHGVLWAFVQKRAIQPVTLGGEFTITVVVPGVDSMTLHAKSSANTRPWITEFNNDSVTGHPVSLKRMNFAFDLALSASHPDMPDSLRLQRLPCAGMAIITDRLPAVLDRDSTWRGTMQPVGFLSCAPKDSRMYALANAKSGPAAADGEAEVRFRRLGDGRLVFEAEAHREGRSSIIVRGEQISSKK